MAQHDVLIVGAGPTGLVLALWLTRQGLRVRIVDKGEGPGATSRATHKLTCGGDGLGATVLGPCCCARAGAVCWSDTMPHSRQNIAVDSEARRGS